MRDISAIRGSNFAALSVFHHPWLRFLQLTQAHFAGRGVAGKKALLKLGEQIFIREVRQIVGLNGRADDNSDAAEAGKWSAAGPGLVGAVHGDRNERDPTAAGYRNEARLERGNFAVAGASSLGEDKHKLARLQPPERLLETAEADPFAVNGNGIEKADQFAQHGELKKRVASEVVHAPAAGEADERRIKVALVIRTHKDAPFGRPVLSAGDAQAEEPHANQPRKEAEGVVGEALGERSLGHGLRRE